MLSKDNLALFDKLEVAYIIGARIKNLTAAWTRKVLDTGSYESGGADTPYQRIREWTDDALILQSFDIVASPRQPGSSTKPY